MKKGVPDLLTASFIWGTIGIVTEIGYDYGANSFASVLIRSVVASVFSLSAVGRKSLVPSRENLIMGAISTAFYEVYVFTIEVIGAPLSAVFLYTAPLFVVVLSKVVTQDAITFSKVVASVMVFLGVYLIYLSDVTTLDLALGVASGLTYALLIVFSRFMQMKGMSDMEIISSQSVWGLPMTMVISFLLSPDVSVSSTYWIYLGVVATVIAYIFFYRGMRRTDSIIASIVTSMEPVFTVVLSWLILKETLTLLQLAGFAVIILSSFVATRRN
ncbi:DMT family transporter [Sulfuracidifex tepidarius]|uniref:DMT family transporter n=1 Tax=Sulfuracidifex tepidarius TaxID=1294262 RepID=UPI0006D18D5D|nr:EamA family transporter [Sulfuracidifex tepidarius]